jgi:hypothetical protein
MRTSDILEGFRESCIFPIIKEKDLDQRNQEMNSLYAKELEYIENETQPDGGYQIKDKIGSSGR